ncbi:phage protein NinX family protein [Proteus mirabilis]|uniref:phage protein NinX family protein n=1 Tax=Proteus mirabilis TaxID=584 RepID=UPI0031B745A4
MNKYTELSDFEINKKVAEYLKLNTIAYECTEIVLFDDMDATPFDPCNNQSDAFPLIIDVKLSIHPDFYNDCESWVVRTVHIPPVKDESLTRAICIAYLLMKDAENEEV